jgi:hypothetical protein
MHGHYLIDMVKLVILPAVAIITVKLLLLHLLFLRFLRPCPAWKRRASTCGRALLPHAFVLYAPTQDTALEERSDFNSKLKHYSDAAVSTNGL